MVVPASLRTIASAVDERLRRLLDHERERWLGVDDALTAPLDALAELILSGGKRLRPAFCHWGWVGAGGAPMVPTIVDAGAAFELLHAFALAHDDVMDGSAVRRGQRTMHLAFADRHEAEGWSGEARRFGEGVAILVGDLAFVYADQLLRGAPPAAAAIWDELRVELNIGQYLDVLGTVRSDRDRAAAERIGRYKSGKYTVERPLHLGAALAGGDGALLEHLSAYGIPLGDAFQLRDDILGAFGESAVTGKPVGDDLREGKPTPLLAIATDRADAAQRAVLGRVGTDDLGADEVAAIQAVLVDTGALGELEAVIDGLRDKALAALVAAPLASDVVDELAALAHYVVQRDH